MLILTLLLLLTASFAQAAETPNIIVVLADDLGYGDLKSYNPETKIPTPNLDRLAAAGRRFTDAHSPDGVCSPTRYALLTGRYAWRTRLKSGVLTGASAPLIAPDRLTIAGMLQEKGYRTGAVGKWHLGYRWPLKNPSTAQTVENVDWSQPLIDGQLQHGFDYSFGLGSPAWTFMENGRVLSEPTEAFDWRHIPAFLIGPNNSVGYRSPAYNHERMLPRFTEEAVGFIDRSAQSGEPFFLYFTPMTPHRPVVPNDAFADKSAAGLYGDFVVELDWAVGQLMAALDRNGVADDTLIFVSSDNGPEVDAYRRVLEYNHRSMGAWRGVKRDTWEGGHRVPLLARWPAKIPAGTTSDETVCLTDLIATVAALVDYDLPNTAAEDSYDIGPALWGPEPAEPIREATVHHGSRGWFAIRRGDWVLIEDHPGDNNRAANGEPAWLRRERGADKPANGELFNLANDPGQTKNRIAEQADRAAAMKALLEKYRTEGRSVARR